MNWPNNGRIAVMMAFDLDGESLWEANHTPIDTLNAPRGSYGPIQGMPRILNLLDKHGIPATFFVPGITAERYPEVVREIGRCGHEIGYHGYIHETSSARDFCQIWRDEFDALAEEGRMLNFVLHPQFIGRASRLNALSDLISYMKDNGAWFATNADTARHVLRQRGYEVAV